MSCCLKAGFAVSGSSDIVIQNRARESFRVCSLIGSLQLKAPNSSVFLGKTLDLSDQKTLSKNWNLTSTKLEPVRAQSSLRIGKAMRWWEKSLQRNMIEIGSAQELVDSLVNAGDKLVIVDFYSPGCGGCKALHPKICQLAELNPSATFLKVNYEEHKAMCYALHVHVLPFFRFYRGADGRVSSFSCTNATIKKFKDALVKHGTERCSLGPAKGLDGKELLALASAGLISRDLVPNSENDEKVGDLVLNGANVLRALNKDDNKIGVGQENAMAMA